MNDLAPAPVVRPPSLRPARLDDYDKIRRLVLAHSFDLPSFEDWRSLWLDNPLRRRYPVPLGWVLETRAGEIVGTMGTAWSLYKYSGADFVSAVGRFWFVASPYRGFALRLMSEYFSQPGVDLYINNTVAPAAIGSFSQLSTRVPAGDWASASYWITAPLAPRLADAFCPPLSPDGTVSSKILPPIPDAFTVESAERFDSRFDVFWQELLKQNADKLLADRSSEALSWHFSIPMQKQRAWIFTASRNDHIRAYCTLTMQNHPFQLPAFPLRDTYGFRGMRLIDFQSIEPEVDLLPGLLSAALQRCAAEGMLLLEHLGRGLQKTRAIDDFAPYRRDLENWKFFYSAADPKLDAELRRADLWDPSAFDGDASFE